jgi:hypothetical protein
LNHSAVSLHNSDGTFIISFYHFGFYDHLRTKPTGRAIMQLVQGLVIIALMVGMFAIFAKLLDQMLGS